MKLSKAQEKELEVWEYFIPRNIKWFSKTDQDIKMFFEWSERGKYKDISTYYNNFSYFEALRQGKRWAGIHMQMYEEGVLDGSMPYIVILGCEPYGPKIPVMVKDFMKKEMFKGIDAELIENCYQNQ